MSDTFRLSDIIARSVLIEWYEGVALLRALTELVTREFSGTGVPDLNEVELAADGGVSASGATETREPVRRMGQLLQAVLTQSDSPVQLRLVISQATAPVPAFSDVDQFSDALGYFERPDRAGVLRRLYAKVSSAPDGRSATVPSVNAIAPLPSNEAATERKRADAPVSRRGAVALLSLAIALGACFGAYKTFGLGSRGERVAAIAVKASDVVGGTVVSGISKVSETVGLGRLAPADSTPPAAGPVPVPAPTRPTSKAPRTTRSREATTESRPLVAFDLDPLLAPNGASASSRQVDTPATGRVVARDVTPDGMVYSASDPGVVAPVGVRPQLPRGLPPNVNKDQLGRIELLILPDGTVGSVKLLGPSRGVPEAMLLSAAKAWTFEPAQVNGRPVSYRKVVWLMLQ